MDPAMDPEVDDDMSDGDIDIPDDDDDDAGPDGDGPDDGGDCPDDGPDDGPGDGPGAEGPDETVDDGKPVKKKKERFRRPPRVRMRAPWMSPEVVAVFVEKKTKEREYMKGRITYEEFKVIRNHCSKVNKMAKLAWQAQKEKEDAVKPPEPVETDPIAIQAKAVTLERIAGMEMVDVAEIVFPERLYPTRHKISKVHPMKGKLRRKVKKQELQARRRKERNDRHKANMEGGYRQVKYSEILEKIPIPQIRQLQSSTSRRPQVDEEVIDMCRIIQIEESAKQVLIPNIAPEDIVDMEFNDIEIICTGMDYILDNTKDQGTGELLFHCASMPDARAMEKSFTDRQMQKIDKVLNHGDAYRHDHLFSGLSCPDMGYNVYNQDPFLKSVLYVSGLPDDVKVSDIYAAFPDYISMTRPMDSQLAGLGYCILTFKSHIDTLLQSQRKLVTVKDVPVQLFLLEFGDHAQVQDRPAGLNVLLHDRSKDAEYQFKEVVIVWAQGNRHIGQVLYQLRQKFEKRGVNIDTILPYCDTVDDIRNHFVKMITCSVAETMRKSGNTDGYSYEMGTIFNPPEPNPIPPGMMQGGPYMQGPYGPPQFFGPAAPHFPQFGPFGEKRQESRKSYRRALASGLPEDWEVYRREQREYKKMIRQSKRETWKSYCTGMGGMMGPPPPFQFSLPQLLMELGQNLDVGDMGGNQQPNNQQPNNQQPKKKLYDQPRGCRGGKKNREKKMQERLAKEAADYAAGIVPEKVGGTGANEVSNYLDESKDGFGKKHGKGQNFGNNQRQNFGQQNKNPYNWKNAGGCGKGNYQQQNRFGNYASGYSNYTSGYANNTKKPFKAKVTYTVDNSVSECMADMTFSTQDTPYIPQSSDNKGNKGPGYIHRYDSQVGKGDGKGSSTSFGIGSVNNQNNRTGFEFTKITPDPVPPPPPAVTSSYTPKANTNVTTQNNGNQGRFSSQNTSGQLSGFGQVGSGQAGNSQSGTGSGQSRSGQSAGASETGSGQSVAGSGQNLSGQNQTKYGGGAGSGDGQYGPGNAALGVSSGQSSGAVGQSSQNYGTSKNTGQYRSGPMTYSAPQTSSGQSSGQPNEQHQTAQQYAGQYNSGQQQNSGQYTSGQQQYGQTNSGQSYTKQQNYGSNNSSQQNYSSNYNSQVQQQTGQQNATNYQQSMNTGQYQQSTSQLTSPYQQTQQSSATGQQSTGQYQQSTGQYAQSTGQSTNQSTSQYQQAAGQGQYQATQRANTQHTQQYAQTPTQGTQYNQGTNQTYNAGSTNTSYQPPGAYPTNTNVAQPQTNQQGYQNTSQQYSSAQYGTSTGQVYGTSSPATQAYNPSTGQYGSTQQYR